jgi:GAF domain-containing protein
MFFDQPLEMEQATDLTVAAAWERSGKPPLAPIGTRYCRDNTPFISLIRRDKPIIMGDIYADEGMDASLRATLKSWGGRGMAIFPLVAGSQWLGILTGQTERVLDIDDDQMRQISSLVDQAAAVIQNQRLFEQAEERAHREQVLRQITAKVRGSADVETIMRTAVQEIGQALGRRTFVYLGRPEEMETEAGEKEKRHER